MESRVVASYLKIGPAARNFALESVPMLEKSQRSLS